jgi:hypothetical protein
VKVGVAVIVAVGVMVGVGVAGVSRTVMRPVIAAWKVQR